MQDTFSRFAFSTTKHLILYAFYPNPWFPGRIGLMLGNFSCLKTPASFPLLYPMSFHSLSPVSIFSLTIHPQFPPRIMGVFCRCLQLLNAPLSLVFLYLYSSQSSDLSGFLPQLEHVTFLIFCWSVGFGIGSYISSGEGEAAVPKIPLKRLYLLSHITALREAVGGSSTPHGYLRTSGFSILLLHSSWLMVKAKSSALIWGLSLWDRKRGKMSSVLCGDHLEVILPLTSPWSERYI